jgi:hypothetical protein
MNHFNTIILPQFKENVRIQIVVIRNDVVCFVLKGAENLPARGRKTEKNITLALPLDQEIHLDLQVKNSVHVKLQMVLENLYQFFF